MVTGSKYTAGGDGALLAVKQTKPTSTPYRTAGGDKSSFRAVLASRARDKIATNTARQRGATTQRQASQHESFHKDQNSEVGSIAETTQRKLNSQKADELTKEAVDQVKDAAILVPEKVAAEDKSDAEAAASAEAAALMAILSVDLVELEQLNATLSQDQAVSLEVKQALETMIDTLKLQIGNLVSGTAETAEVMPDLQADSQVDLTALKQLIADTANQFESFLQSDAATKASVDVKALDTLLSNLNGRIEKMFKTTRIEMPQQSATLENAVAVQSTAEQIANQTANNASDGDAANADTAKTQQPKVATESVNGFAEVVDESTAVSFEADRQMATQVEATQNLKQNQSTFKTAVFEQIKTAIEKDSATAGLADRSTMIVKLKPEALGKVELKIEVHNDNVIAKFNVASQMVKEAIESNFEDLRNSLKDKGFSDMAFDVNVNSGNGEEKRESFNQRQNKRQAINIPSDAEKGETSYIRSLSALIHETTFEHSI